MYLVDEQDRALVRLDLLHDLLETLLEIAAISGAGEQRAHVEREDRGIGENVGNFPLGDLARETFGDRRLADAGVADQQRIVLLPPAENLDRALHLGLAADQRIDPAVLGLLVEIDAIGVERALLLLAVAAALARLARLVLLALFLGAAHRLGVGHAGTLGDAVADVIDRVVAGHVLLLQEIGSMALALGEDRDEHVCAGHLLAARRLHMDDRALDDALETGGRLGVVAPVGDEIVEFGIDVIAQCLAQRVQIDRAGPHDRGRVQVVDEAEQQVLERRIFMAPFIGGLKRPVKRLLEIARKGRHASPHFFSMMHWSGC